jgi:thiol-disulfide isomerase/thioredoxin
VASTRLPLPAVIAATALALVAALGTLALLDGGDEGEGAVATDEAAGDGYQLSPTGELPASVAEVRLASLEGGADRPLRDLIGTTPVVINFFGSWCAPCIEEMPAFERVHRDLGDQVTFLGMANRDAPEDALATVEATGVTYPVFDDPDANALTYFGGLAMPTTVFIDASGQVVDVNSGPLTEDELRARITDVLGVPA